MVTKKQLAALAKARAVRARKAKARHVSKRTYKKRTKAEFADSGTSPKKPEYKDVEVMADLDIEEKGKLRTLWEIIKSCTVYVFKLGYIMAKAGYNEIRGQSARLTYIKYYLKKLTEDLDAVNDKTSDVKIEHLKKSADMLVQLTDLESAENKKLSKKFIRDIYAIPTFIEKIKKDRQKDK